MTKHLLALSLLVAGCFPAKAPVRTSFHPGADPDTLVVMLPGFGARDQAFADKGIIAAAREAGIQADLVAVDMTFGYYIRDQLETRLREDVFTTLAPRYEHVWVLGISMGGVGSLLTAKDFRKQVDGVILLSPYLGRKKTLDAVRSGRELADYNPADERAWDEDLWDWLKHLEEKPEKIPPIYLGYGTTDLGLANLAWFARYLPKDHVRIVPGGHAWPTWAALVKAFGEDQLRGEVAFGAPEVLAVERSAPPAMPEAQAAEPGAEAQPVAP